MVVETETMPSDASSSGGPYPNNMDRMYHQYDPDRERVNSAADAMLKLSSLNPVTTTSAVSEQQQHQQQAPQNSFSGHFTEHLDNRSLCTDTQPIETAMSLANDIIINQRSVSVGTDILTNQRPVSVGTDMLNNQRPMSARTDMLTNQIPVSIGTDMLTNQRPMSVRPDMLNNQRPMSAGTDMLNNHIPISACTDIGNFDEMRPRSMSLGTSRSPLSLYNDNSCSDDSRPRSSSISSKDRAERAFVPANKKDKNYWSRRKKNNEAAKRSREKRKMQDMATTEKAIQLTNLNNELKEELRAIKEHFGLPVDKPFCPQDKSQSRNVADTAFFQNLKPMLPALPLAAMAALLQQHHQQLATQAAATTSQQYLNNSAANSQVNVKPLVVLPQSDKIHENPMMISTAESNTTTSNPMTTAPTLLESMSHSTSSNNLPYSHYLPRPAASRIPSDRVMNDRMDNQESVPIKRSKTSDPENSDEEMPMDIKDTYPIKIKKETTVKNGHDIYTSAAIPLSSSVRNEDVTLPKNMNQITPSIPSQHHPSQGELPIKLRYKQMNLDQMMHQSSVSSNTAPDIDQGSGLTTAMSEVSCRDGKSDNDPYKLQCVPSVINDVETTTDEDDFSISEDSDSTNQRSFDKNDKYWDRRHRNNLAARKCRKNRQLQMKIKQEQSNELESVNQHLKDNIQRMTNQMLRWREIVKEKTMAEEQGKNYKLPPLEVLERMISDQAKQLQG